MLRKGMTMNESVYKIVEVVGTSYESWEKAAELAVKTASKSLHDIRIAEVIKLDMHFEAEQIAYRARLQLSFRYHD
jgi:flavin-binding protein dodecin